MEAASFSPVIDHLRRAALLPHGAGMNDGQLLECYVVRRDEAAFEALMRLDNSAGRRVPCPVGCPGQERC